MNKLYVIITLNIIALFAVVMLTSFIPDYFPTFFGDWHCVGGQWHSKTGIGLYGTHVGCLYTTSDHDPTWHWGFRHWIFFFMGLALFITHAVRIIIDISKNAEKKA